MKKLPYSCINALAVVSLMLVAATAYATEIVAKSYDIKNVSEVVVSGNGRLEIVQGDLESLRIEASQEVMTRVIVDQSSNKLTISVKNMGKGFNFFRWFDNNKDEVNYILSVKQLKFLGVSGALQTTLGNLTGKHLKVKASGAAYTGFADLNVEEFFVELSGASNVSIQQLGADKAKFELSGAANFDVKAPGRVKFLEVGASGASNFRGKPLEVSQAEANASGASNIDLKATEFLEAHASGASNIRYLGKPKLESNASGASNIKAIAD